MDTLQFIIFSGTTSHFCMKRGKREKDGVGIMSHKVQEERISYSLHPSEPTVHGTHVLLHIFDVTHSMPLQAHTSGGEIHTVLHHPWLLLFDYYYLVIMAERLCLFLK